MLRELRIENLVLIERAELRLGPGLNVFTGETGAGKTMLAHALDLLLGSKPAKGAVRPGAAEAYVEGVFELPAGLLARDEFADLRERLPNPDANELVLARRISAEGRSRAFVEGRSATAADLTALGGALVAFHGQHEHRRLTSPRAQLEILDRFAGDGQAERLVATAAAYKRLHDATRELEELNELAQRSERELGLIEFELEEIERLAPDPALERELNAERSRLLAVESLRQAAAEALAVLDPDDPAGGASGASGALSNTVAALEAPGDADPSLAALTTRATALQLEAAELASDLRGYFAGLADDPERLAQLEEQLDGWELLKRKHGGTLEAVIEHGERCRAERDRLVNADLALEQADARRDAARAELDELAAGLHAARSEAAAQLAPAVALQLGELAMDGARFEVSVEGQPGEPGPRGNDSVDFLLAPNPGLPLAPMRETASGGELSRALLALLLASRRDRASTGDAGNGTGDAGNDAHDRAVLVFDEIDSGIGGHTARAVGDKLRRLGEGRQVLCITHLPQVAAAGTTHFRIEKQCSADATRTVVDWLDGEAVVEELCRMLGANADDEAARDHARELRAAA